MPCSFFLIHGGFDTNLIHKSKPFTISGLNDALYEPITILPALKVVVDATIVIMITSISRSMHDNIRSFNESDCHHCKVSNGVGPKSLI